jgi:hypothetical protein
MKRSTAFQGADHKTSRPDRVKLTITRWLGLGVGLTIMGLPVHARDVPFRLAQEVPGRDLAELHTVDYDRDGTLDILGTESGLGRTAVYLLSGPPPWTENLFPEQTFNVDSADAMAIGDLNGDGYLEMVMGGIWSGRVPQVLARGITIDDMLVDNLKLADLDGDGDLDILGGGVTGHVDGRTMGQVGWWENSGRWTNDWTRHTLAELETTNIECEAADLDGDGDLDIIAGTSSIHGSKLIWWENISGRATNWLSHVIDTNQPAYYEPQAIDLDLDGDLDLVVAHPLSPGFSVWKNTAAQFRLAATFTSTGSLTAGDFDLDGDLDLFLAPFRGTELAWFENQRGDLTSWTYHSLPRAVDNVLGQACVGDFDRDGDLDVLYRVTGNLRYWLENELIHRNAIFPQKYVISDSFNGAECVRLADVNGDGRIDVIGSAYGAGDIKVWLNLDPLHNLWWTRTVTTNFSGVEAVYPADLDGDGDVDILGASLTSDSIRWWENDGDILPSWTDHLLASGFNGAHDVVAADLDRDGDLDVAAVAYFGNQVAWWENDGTPRNGGWKMQVVSDSYLGANAIALTDMNRDGLPDILATSWVNGQIRCWRNEEVGFKRTFVAEFVSDDFDGVRAIQTADINRDGRPDVVAAAYKLGKIRWWDRSSTASYTMHVLGTNTFAGANDVCPADLDQDGDVDLVGAFLVDGHLRWWENLDGSGTQWKLHTEEIDFPSGASVRAADLDQDGDLDLVAAAEGTTDQIAWWPNQGGQCGLRPTVIGPDSIGDGQRAAILAVDTSHNGRVGDHAMELAGLELEFEIAPGRAMTQVEWNRLFASVAIYRDDGNGTWGIEDTPVQSYASPTVSGGIAVLSLDDGRPSASIPATADRRFFVVLETTANAHAQSPNQFRLSYGPTTSHSAEDRENDLPLLEQLSIGVTSAWYTVSAFPTLRILSVTRLPDGNWGLQWNSLGADYAYTIEYSALSPGIPWRNIPWVEWPITRTNYVVTQVLPDAARVFFRIKASR